MRRVELRWNDPTTILRGAHWWLAEADGGRRTTLTALVQRLAGPAGRLVLDAAQSSLYLRSLVGLHRAPVAH
jgi:hypothetical protein